MVKATTNDFDSVKKIAKQVILGRPLSFSDPVIPEATDMQVEFKVFRGTFKTWDKLFEQAAKFAAEIGREHLINISHSSEYHDGVVTVWYWAG